MQDAQVDQQSALERIAGDQYWRLNNLYSIRTKNRGLEGRRIIFVPNRTQRIIYQALEDGHKRVIILKPRKLGVTTGIAIYLLDKALYSPNQMCRSIAHRKQTVTELFHDIPNFAIKTLQDTNPSLLPELEYTTKSEIVVKRTGSKYSIDVEARGMTPTYLHFSEIAYFEDEAKFQDSLESLSPGNVCLCESTANGRGNWFERTFMNNWNILQSGEKPEWLPLFFPWFDDPQNATHWESDDRLFFPDECKVIEAKYRNSDGTPLSKEQMLWWDHKKYELRERMPELYPSEPEEAFIFSTGKVYGEYHENLNMIHSQDFKNFDICMDYGQTNPMVFLFVNQDHDNNFTVFREFYRRDCPIKEASMWLHEYAPMDSDGYVYIKFPDPSIFNKTQVNFIYKPGEEHRYSIADDFRRHKVICRPGTQNDIASGLARMKEYLQWDPMHPNPYKRTEDGESVLGSPRLFITKDCIKTREEFDLYRWPKERVGTLDQSLYEVPIKKCFPKNVNVITNSGEKSISDVSVGDFVLSAGGFTEVLESNCTGVEETMIIQTKNTTLEATPGHQVFVIGKGLTAMSDIKYNDHICVIENKEAMPMDQGKKSGLTELCIIVIQMLLIQNQEDQEETILSTLPQKRGTMLSYGKRFIREKFLQGVRFITRTVILLITILKILCVSILQTIQEFIKTRSHLKRIFVNSVIKNLNPRSLESGDLQHSAIQTVDLINIIKRIDTMNGESVKHAVKRNMFTKIIHHNIVQGRVLSVQDTRQGKKPVYNLKTANGMYYANGVLTSNCDHAMDALRYLILSCAAPLFSEEDSNPIIPRTPRAFMKQLEDAEYEYQKEKALDVC